MDLAFMALGCVLGLRVVVYAVSWRSARRSGGSLSTRSRVVMALSGLSALICLSATWMSTIRTVAIPVVAALMVVALVLGRRSSRGAGSRDPRGSPFSGN